MPIKYRERERKFKRKRKPEKREIKGDICWNINKIIDTHTDSIKQSQISGNMLRQPSPLTLQLATLLEYGTGKALKACVVTAQVITATSLHLPMQDR